MVGFEVVVFCNLLPAVELLVDGIGLTEQAAKRVNLIRESVSSIKGVTSEMFVPEIHYRVPHVRVRWDGSSTRLTVRDAIKLLREGDPSIEVRPNTNDGLEMGVWLLDPGDTEIVARRLHQVLKSG